VWAIKDIHDLKAQISSLRSANSNVQVLQSSAPNLPPSVSVEPSIPLSGAPSGKLKERWKGGNLPEGKFLFDVVTLIHIPKTGGMSLREDLKKNMPFTNGLHNPEKCYGAIYHADPRDFHLTILREPRSHVMSQYLQCRYSPWGKDRIEHRGLPGKNENFYVDFAKWVDHFYEKGEEGTRGSGGDYNCYNPINMMTRQMACKRNSQKSNVGPHHILSDPWNITLSKAMEHMDTIDFVGLTELYPESLCLAIYMVQGKLPPGCGEGCIEMKTTHDSHGVPKHSTEKLSMITKERIDSFTKWDQDLYRAGVIRFLFQVKKAELETGATILCQKRRDALFQKIRHMGGLPDD